MSQIICVSIHQISTLTFLGPKSRAILSRLGFLSVSATDIFPMGGDLGIFTKRQNHGNAEADSERFEKFVSFLRSELPLPGDTSLVVEALDAQLTRLRADAHIPTDISRCWNVTST